MHWFQIFLILHLLTVLLAFGPDFAFPVLATMAQKEPQHGAFATEIIHFIEAKLTIPLAVLVPLFGVGLIYTGHFALWQSTWLIIAVIAYPIVFFFALFVQLPNTSKMLRLLHSMPPGPPPEGAAPPPEIERLGKRLQAGGIFLSVMIILFVVLMVWRPGNCINGQIGC